MPQKGIYTKLGGSSGSSGRGGRARTGGLFFIALDDTQGKRHLRDLKGKFINLEANLNVLHKQLAERMAEQMVANLTATLLRPGVSTGRLARALMDPKNRVSDRFGFGAGKIDFLDRSEAKYWRAIELGTTAHLGREIKGVWGGTLTGEEGGGGKYGPYPLAGAPFTGFGYGTGGRLRPMSRKKAYALLRERGATSRQASRSKGIIKVPIRGHLYMRNAFKKAQEEYPGQVQQAFVNAGLPKPRKGAPRTKR